MYIALPAEELLFLFRAFFFPGIFICILKMGKLRHGVMLLLLLLMLLLLLLLLARDTQLRGRSKIMHAVGL